MLAMSLEMSNALAEAPIMITTYISMQHMEMHNRRRNH
uniref:Uncharacterized protein n=1 Tax=Arundo donax TaxID=35708 RepID=A0A0A9FX56_ARUDO